MTERKKVTIKDVAKEAGVVPSTVSHVLHGTATITQETKNRVMEAVNRLGYSPNASARALRSKHSGLIGVVLPDVSCEFYAQCAAYIMREAHKDKYTVLLCDSYFQKEGVKALMERCVDGFIFFGGGGGDEIINYIAEKDIPIVLGDREYKDFCNVSFDNEQVLDTLVQAFYESGYRKFAYLSGPKEVQTNLAKRYKGFENGVNRYSDIDVKVIFEKNLPHNLYNAGYEFFIKHFINNGEIPQIIFTTTDMMAQGVVRAAVDSGVRIPENMAVVGVNDMTVSKYFTPPLTTIRQDICKLAKGCYSSLMKMIMDKEKPENIVIQQQAVIRKSAVVPRHIMVKYNLIDGMEK